MCLMSKKYDWKRATVSDQRSMKDFIFIIMRPMSYDMIATEGATCGAFVHLAAGASNSELLDLAFDQCWDRNFYPEDVAHSINVPAKNYATLNAYDISWNNR